MADFSKFKIGNTSYNVKDAAAGKSLSVSGSSLSLKNAAGTAISTVTLPGGNTKVYDVQVEYTDNVTTSMTDFYDGMTKGNGSWSITSISPSLPAGQHISDITDGIVSYTFYVNFTAANEYDVLYANFIGFTHPLVFIQKDRYDNTIMGCVALDINTATDSVVELEYTSFSSGGGGGSANTNIAFIAQTSGWPTLNTIYYIPGNYKLTNQIGIKSTGYGQYGPTETSILASALLIDDTYASAEAYLATSPAQGSTFKIVAWFIANVNTIAKVTATCTYDGNGGYTVSNASATSATVVGQ